MNWIRTAMTVCAAFAVSGVFGAPASAAKKTMPREQWQAEVGNSAKDPKALAEVMKQLDSADKPAFVAAVNVAIEKMPGSVEQRTSLALAANTAALESAGKADRMPVLAEIFASAPIEALTVINEQFGKNFFNRDAAATLTDKEFTQVAKTALEKITARCATAEASAVRETFAILMFVEATASSSSEYKETLTKELVQTLPAESQATATEKWIPPASTEANRDYTPMLGEAQVLIEPDHDVVLQVTPAQMTTVLVGELVTEQATEVGVPFNRGTQVLSPSVKAQVAGADDSTGVQGGTGTATIPRELISNPVGPDGKTNPYYSPSASNPHPQVNPTPEPEPEPYNWQTPSI